ncbi:hypothetical protein CIRG_07626 [Coccidioides immitis RMSCC 2394]|uniref:Uncharacterized protein n=1 Tax=Coccidioides immitis RMSCC 2394 TaxID=404692 RepID=A0A0J6YJW4_COCIT|nr:hypothetical protein CIRG_07626 [Coccidioides immitis RMSCC 2394]
MKAYKPLFDITDIRHPWILEFNPFSLFGVRGAPLENGCPLPIPLSKGLGLRYANNSSYGHRKSPQISLHTSETSASGQFSTVDNTRKQCERISSDTSSAACANLMAGGLWLKAEAGPAWPVDDNV